MRGNRIAGADNVPRVELLQSIRMLVLFLPNAAQPKSSPNRNRNQSGRRKKISLARWPEGAKLTFIPKSYDLGKGSRCEVAVDSLVGLVDGTAILSSANADLIDDICSSERCLVPKRPVSGGHEGAALWARSSLLLSTGG